MSRGFDHLRQMHQMCMEELQVLEENIAAYRQSSAKMHKQLTPHCKSLLDKHYCADSSSNANVPLIAYDNLLTNLSHVMELARKFNLHLRFNKLEQHLRGGGGSVSPCCAVNNNNCRTLSLPNGCKNDLNLSWHMQAQKQEDQGQLEMRYNSAPQTLSPPPGFERKRVVGKSYPASQPITEIKKEAFSRSLPEDALDEIRCFNCNLLGHYQGQCPYGKRRSESCYRCWEMGHVHKNCPNPHKLLSVAVSAKDEDSPDDEEDHHDLIINGVGTMHLVRPKEEAELHETTVPPPTTNGTTESSHCNINGYDYDTLSIPPIEEGEQINDSALSDAQFPGPIFNYPQRELAATYQPGCVLDASVTFVQDSCRLRFFICDARSPGMATVLELHHMVNLRQYTDLPAANEIFGLALDDVILRAVRPNKSQVATDNAYPALLLDFGEVVEVSVAENVMYHLPVVYQETPAQAILCQLHGSSDDHRTVDDLQLKLEKLEYQRASFRVEALVENVLHLQLITGDDDAATATTDNDDDNNFDRAASSPPPSAAISNTNPFKQSAVLNEDLAASDPTEQVVPLTPIGRDPFDTATAAALLVNNTPPHGLTRDDWEMLYEEPLGTTNAMTAVMGYDPKDDQRICRFYDAAIGACFKGANCKQEHTAAQPEGWTKDALPAATIIDNRTPMMRYAVGTIISITPTYVGQPERFYAQIDDPKSPQTPLIFNPEDVPDWKRLQKPPLTFELVLARYDDELWYRAKIIEADEQNKMFSVFYVDYGNQQMVPLRDLARCDYSIAQLPFQAVICRVAGVREDAAVSPELRRRGISTLCNLILNQTFDVRVLGHHEDLLVRFVDQRFTQLPRTLIEMGCVLPFKTAAT